MTEAQMPREPREGQEPRKQPYTTPQLVRHGTVEDLTQGAATFRGGDGASFPNGG
jgi:hypothetical protein